MLTVILLHFLLSNAILTVCDSRNSPLCHQTHLLADFPRVRSASTTVSLAVWCLRQKWRAKSGMHWRRRRGRPDDDGDDDDDDDDDDIDAYTWSSRLSWQKAGMYLAHSTMTISCCCIDWQISCMLAGCFWSTLTVFTAIHICIGHTHAHVVTKTSLNLRRIVNISLL